MKIYTEITLASHFRGCDARWSYTIDLGTGSRLTPGEKNIFGVQSTDQSFLHLLVTRELQFAYEVTLSPRLRPTVRTKPRSTGIVTDDKNGKNR
jgi:hypothetical protein